MVGNYGDVIKPKTKKDNKTNKPDYEKLKGILARKSGENISLKQARKIGEFLLKVHEIINKSDELD